VPSCSFWGHTYKSPAQVIPLIQSFAAGNVPDLHAGKGNSLCFWCASCSWHASSPSAAAIVCEHVAALVRKPCCCCGCGCRRMQTYSSHPYTGSLMLPRSSSLSCSEHHSVHHHTFVLTP
jgi:hypothetical protein